MSPVRQTGENFLFLMPFLGLRGASKWPEKELWSTVLTVKNEAPVKTVSPTLGSADEGGLGRDLIIFVISREFTS